MKNIRNLIGSKLIDVEVNINGFTVLYFEDEKGNVCSVDLCPTVRKLKEGTAQENNSRAVKSKTINQMRSECGLNEIEDGDITLVHSIKK